MKAIYHSIITMTVCGAMAATLTACGDVLDEQPRTIYDPSFFKTDKGIDGGLASLYANLRNVYGNGYFLNICETGTDEYTYGQSADANFKDADFSGAGSLTSSSSRSSVLWDATFTFINTASGIIENAEEGGVDESKISEARFFRAFYYFNLVRTFGGVPLDFGSGELRFNATPSRTSVRNTVPEVYTKAVFPDLLTAVRNLPDDPRTTGAATKTVARKFLAEAYLTYAWWLQNPKNIPTYPECSRTDPDGHDATWYFQQAYDLCVEGLQNPGPYGLCDTYYDVTRYTNDRNREVLLFADHTTESAQYNGMTESGSSWGYAGGSSPDNFAGWMANWNYPNLQMKSDKGTWINPCQREAIQPLGRPWIRMAPCIDAIENFTDKGKDSRYDATFTTVYHANWEIGANAGDDIGYVVGHAGQSIPQGGVVLRFLDEEPATPVNYSTKSREHGAIGAGTLDGYAEYVINPEAISRLRFPAIYKLGMYPLETLSSDGKRQLGSPNGPIARPFNIAKFSEFYLLAAEAAVKGATTKPGYSARELLNVLRARAGKWTHRVNGTTQYCEEFQADYSAELTAATPQDITIDVVLDERMRELFGEGYRWYDLTRTQTWAEKAGTYRICGMKATDVTPETITRDIRPEHYLRPIPQTTIDAFEMSDEMRADYQNPSYRQ